MANNADKLAVAIDHCNQAIDAALAAMAEQRATIIELQKATPKRRAKRVGAQ